MKNVKYLLLLLIIVLAGGNTGSFSKAYTIVNGSTDIGNAPSVSIGKEYAATLKGYDMSCFKFTTPAKKGFFDIYCKNISIPTHSWSISNKVEFVIVDELSDLKEQIYLGVDSECSTNLSLEPNTTYYLKVKNNWVEDETLSGNFKFKITYVADETPDTKAEAKKISKNQMVAETLDGSTDVDYFKFVTGNWKKYEFDVKNINIETQTRWHYNMMFCVSILNELDEEIKEIRVGEGESSKGNVTLKPNTTYYVKVYNPTKDRGRYKFSINHKVSEKVKKLNLKNIRKKSAKITYKSSGKATGYQIYCADNKKMKWPRVKEVQKKKTVIKNLKKGQIYYFKVRVYQMIDGKKVYGEWSSTKKLKIKK